MVNKKYVVYLGSNGFPYGLSEIQKIILISKCLVLTGNHVTIICNKGIHNETDHPELKATGNFENIEYVYTSGDPFYNKNIIKRNLLKARGIINEFSLLRKRKKDHKLNYAILSTQSFSAILFYSILSKIYGFKTILNYVEYFSGIKKKWFKVGRRLNDKLLDKCAPLLVDGVFPISEFIINNLKKVSPGKKYLKIPGLTEFERYNGIEAAQEEKYFLFCGAANYKEIVQFAIDSFGKLQHTSAFLYLVINGNESDIMAIKDYAGNTSQKDNIRFFSKLPEKQLFNYYKNAIGLLIPLRPTFQDIARFPHKIGEYLASGNPVISTNYGEVKYYFEDMKNMLLADEYNVSQFAAKMQFVIDNPDSVKKIGTEGRNKALSIFDYRTKAPDIDNFLDSI